MRIYPQGLILEGVVNILANVDDVNQLFSQDLFNENHDQHVVMCAGTLKMLASKIPLDDTEMTLEEALDRLEAVSEEVRGPVDDKTLEYLAFLLGRGIIDKSELIKASNSLYPPTR